MGATSVTGIFNNGAGAADAYGAGNKGSERMSLGVHRLIGPRVVGAGSVTLTGTVGNVYFPTLPGGSSLYSVQLTGNSSASPYVSKVLPPVMTGAAPSAGGSLATGVALFYKITAINGNGETTTSNEETATPSGGNLSITLTWTADNGATGYKIYRGTVTNTENVLVATVMGGSTVTFVDTGAATTSVTPPVVNTANSFGNNGFIVTAGSGDIVFWTIIKNGIWGSTENDGLSSQLANT